MEKGDGMSFAELTYPLLQAWDWCAMYRDSAVQLQVGGSDQYGNIVAGIDAIKFMAAQRGRDAAAALRRRLRLPLPDAGGHGQGT